ncbi:DUF3419 family protein [Pedobacter sp. SYSU D00535]|uniref:DUF3419 family protein n=1 Tax=Pedobacter sp. SYSU D00535 TaxID=2810308 RepID=UPI001A96FA5E|nr:DUF3419 family protein [Pedobacter sp. SYSU D00535]
MKSEFSKIELDQIRYSLVWEDATTLYESLDIQPDDTVLVITSAGCNVLNTLLKNPAEVIAIDLNSEQNKLLQFKIHLIQHFDHETFLSLVGFAGADAVAPAWNTVRASLSPDHQQYWDAFFRTNPAGIVTAGRLERYITAFLGSINEQFRLILKKLLTCKDLAQQEEYFFNNLHGTEFSEKFISYFDKTNLSKGRDPRLFQYATDSCGQVFYDRLVAQIRSSLASENFFLRFFFFGPENIPQQLLPPCYQEANFTFLKQAVRKVRIIDGEAVEFLLSEQGRTISKASLSNIFEYTSAKEFDNVYTALSLDSSRRRKILFWNLLNEQANNESYERINVSLSEKNSRLPRACFYFKNVRILETKSTADLSESTIENASKSIKL